jgi:methylase of polypeptide subunit release factors
VSTPLLDAAGIARLREAFQVAQYTPDGVAGRLGNAAVAECGGVGAAEVLRMTAGTDPLSTLLRLFLGGATEPAPAVAAALKPLDLPAALAAGLVERDGTGVRAAVDLHPYQGWWIVADLRGHLHPGRPTPVDHVMCAGPVSNGLADAVVPGTVATALDIATGSGVQALHLSRHAGTVTATDLSPRALRFAATTAALNGLDWELLAGDLAGPVAGRRFDLVVCNPPFVVGTGQTRLLYQDSGRPGDAVGAELAATAPGLLTEGGFLQYAASWLHIRGQDWTERVAAWVGPGLDGWIVEGAVQEPVSYVDGWLAQSGDADPAHRSAWLDWFDRQGAEAVGTGYVTLRRTDRAEGVVRAESMAQRTDPGLGAEVLAWFARQDWLRDHDPLDGRLRPGPGLRLWQRAAPAAPDGWRLDRQVLSLTAGLRWAEEADPLVVNLVSACDGSRPVREQLAALAAAGDADLEAVIEAARPHLPHLVERGFLVPAELSSSG